MTQEEILEGNKLIAEFLYPNLRDRVLTRELILGEEAYAKMVIIHEDYHLLRYHSSWDWLMPVVEKIEQIKCVNVYTSKTTHGEFSIEISYETPSYAGIQNNKSIFIKDKTLTKIESTYKAAIEFIKWYNEQKK